uniref:ZP domain-containing protein n=1 Tax=Meloidogyne hapla TaxID=6305 RepID=A0A1I8B6V0_MELHA
MLFGTVKQNKKSKNTWWLIHSCSVSSIDNSVRIELIDSNGCSIDQKLISNFHMQTTINPSLEETFSNQKISLNSSQILTTKTVLASAFIPSIFKIDSESTTINGDLLKFECLIDPCNGKEIPCNFPQRDCGTKTIKTTTQNINEKENEENIEKDNEEAFKQQENDLELVTTQLLINNENKENLKQNITNNLFSTTSQTTTTLSPFLINSSNLDEFSNPNFSFNFDSSIEKRQQDQHLIQIIAHVHDKQEKLNEELNNNLKANNSLNFNEKLIISTTNIENQSTPLFIPIKTSRLRTRPSASSLIEQPNISLESTTQQNIEENNFSTLFESSSLPNNYLSTSSYSSSSLNLCSPNNCITQNQLIQIFWICIFLCFIFVFGCFCNLLVCCFGNKRNERNNIQNSGKWQKYEKKGKGRIVIGQQKLISSVNPQQLNCPPYNSNDTINKQKKQPESTDLWISSNGVSFNERIGQGNGGECLEMESSHFGPITSNTTSIYGALPIHNPQGNTPSNRRCSMLSYASVKAPIHSTIGGRCSNANIIQNQIPASRIFASSQNQQNNKNIRSTSPSSLHSPSTTNTSSGGNGMRETAGDAYHHNHHQPQQPQLQTFLQQSPNHQQLQQQQPSSSLASSSMRSSTLGTPSPSDLEDQQTGTSTPRPSMDFGTTQKHQQADTDQHIIYDQNQSSPGVALQNYLTKTVIAGGPDKHESSSFF